MKTPVLAPTSAAKAGWVILLLTVGWVVFFLVPWTTIKPADKPALIKLPPSKLRQAGLRDYTDWEGLPEIFAIWADKAEWKDGRTRFAYWHPIAKKYGYFFEASRVKGGYRFKEIAEPHEADHYWDEGLGEDCPIRFFRSIPNDPHITLPAMISVDPKGPDTTKVKLETTAPEIPHVEREESLPNPDPKH